MINSIKTQLFETHIDMEIELHPGVNTFVGESDEGKSGIVRQIKWNSRNRPNGDSYRNDKLDPKKKADKFKATVVGIDYKDAAFIVRARDAISGGVNHYQIDDTEPLRALRMDVPDEVQELTRMKDVNIQTQHPTDQYFLLADNPGQVAKKFNKVAGLTIMDDAIKNINAKVRACNTAINISKTEIENKEKELKETEWVLKAKKFAKKLSDYEGKLIRKSNKLDILNDNIYRIKKVDAQLQKYKNISMAKTVLDILSKQKLKIDSKEKEIIHIHDLILSIKSIDLSLKSSVDTDKALKFLKSLKILKTNIREDEYRIKEIKVLLHKIKVNEEQYQIADRDLMESKKEHDIIREETECPTCGRKGK